MCVSLRSLSASVRRSFAFGMIAMAAFLTLRSSCANLGRGIANVNSGPISDQYKSFRQKKRLLYIQNFDNRTYSPQLTGRLKDKLMNSFSRSVSLKLTEDKEKAEVVLYGKIIGYAEEPGVYDNATSSPSTYNLTVVVATRMRARSQSTKDDIDPLTEEHSISYMTTYNPSAPLYETRFDAEDRMLQGIADRIVGSTYEPDIVEKK